ncbi:MAG: GNAT family N-acetyltransferase [Alphaproteobacteria bacterium]|nr:GNAT family N-acetyltransferase [Alphaproteobacteria bacterium]
MLEGLQGPWEALERQVGSGPFTSYALFRAWWDCLGRKSGYQPHFVTAWQDDVLVGLLPLMVRKRMGVRILGWAGANYFDYNAALVARAGIVDALWDEVYNAKSYDFAIITDIRPNLADHAALKSFSLIARAHTSYIFQNSWENAAVWQKSLSHKHRRNMRVKLQNLQAQGPVRFVLQRQGEVSGEAIDTMLAQKKAWSYHHNKNSSFMTEDSARLFHAMVQHKASRGELLLVQLLCKGQLLASFVGFVHHNKVYYYFTAHDIHWQKFSPGTVLTEYALGWLIDEHLDACDFMCGEESYKKRHANGSQSLISYLFAKSLTGRASLFLYLGLHDGRNILHAFYKRLPLRLQIKIFALYRRLRQ